MENPTLNDAVKYGIIIAGLAGGWYGLKNSTANVEKAVAKIDVQMQSNQEQLSKIELRQLKQGFAIKEVNTAMSVINKTLEKKTKDRWTAKDAQYKNSEQDNRIDALERAGGKLGPLRRGGVNP